MPEPLVSVVIPTYNYGHFVCEAVESALAQTYPSVEVIVVDDGSTDDTRERLSVYSNRIRYIHQHNQGLSAARNAGIQAALGKYVALLDSDDQYHPEFVAKLLPLINDRPELALVGSQYMKGGSPEWTQDFTRIREPSLVPLEAIALKPTEFCSSSVIIRRSVFGQIGCFDVALRSVEDRDMWIRIAAQYPVLLVHAPLAFVREHRMSMSHNPSRMEQFEHEVIRRAFNIPALQKKRLLRRKAHGHAALSASFVYLTAGWPANALSRVLQSFCWWPFPYRSGEVRVPLVRIRIAAAALKKLAKRCLKRDCGDPNDGAK